MESDVESTSAFRERLVAVLDDLIDIIISERPADTVKVYRAVRDYLLTAPRDGLDGFYTCWTLVVYVAELKRSRMIEQTTQTSDGSGEEISGDDGSGTARG